MGFTKLGAEIWRDFVTAGVAASGLWSPRKADVVTWATEVESQIGDFFSSVVAMNGTGIVDDSFHKSLIVLPANGTSITATLVGVGSLRANYAVRFFNPSTSGRFHKINTGSDIIRLPPGQSVVAFRNGPSLLTDRNGDRWKNLNTEIFVNQASGSDDNDGMSMGVGGPKRSLGEAWRSMYEDFDHSSSFGTVNVVGGGVFNESLFLNRQPVGCPVLFMKGYGGQQFTIRQAGDSSKAYCMQIGDGVTIEVSDAYFDASGFSYPRFLIAAHQQMILDFLTNVKFGSCDLSHINMDGGACRVNMNASYEIAGNASSHISAGPGVTLTQQGGITVTTSGTPTIGTMYRAAGAGTDFLLGPGATYVGAPASGCQQYAFDGLCQLHKSAGATIPGTISGGVTNGAQAY